MQTDQLARSRGHTPLPLELRVSLHADAAPAPGLVDPPFHWDDVLRAPAPTSEDRGPPTWCVQAPETLTGDVRIENPLLVRLVDGHVEVDDRLCVTRRLLAPAIHAERETVGARLEQAKENAHARADEAHPAAAVVHRAHAATLATARRMTKGIVRAPDRLATRARRAAALLSTPEGRKRVREGLVDPNPLTGEEKAVTLFVGVSGILAATMLAHFVVTLAAPDLARPWRTTFLLFLYAFVTSLGLPLPIEPAIIPAALSVGVVAAVGTAVLAKVLAAWMVFFLGDEVNDRLRARAERRPWIGRALDASEAFARRFGLFAVAAFIATPGLPDVVALYIFGSLHMKLWQFLLGVAIGGLVLYTALTVGFLRLFGLG